MSGEAVATVGPREVVTDSPPPALPSAARFRWGLLVVLAVQAVVAWVYSGASYFFADDFLFFRLARQAHGLPWQFLSRSAFGHFVPGFFATQKVFQYVFGTDYFAARVIMVAISLAATVAMYRLIAALIRPGWIALVVAAWFGLCPITMNAVIWWGISTSVYASHAANVAVFGCFVRWVRTGRARHLVGMAVSYAVAMAFWEKSALTALYLFAFAALVLDARVPVRERWRTMAARWPAWAILAALGAIDLGYYFHGTYLKESGAAPHTAQVLKFLGLSFPEGLAAGLFGMRVPQVLLFGSIAATAVVCSVVIAGLAAYTSVRSRVVLQAWVFFVLAYLVNQTVLARGRVGIAGIFVGRDFRYQYDDLYLVCICLALSFTALPRWQAVPLAVRRGVPAVGLAVVVLVASLSASTMRSVVRLFPGSSAKTYFAKFRHDWSAVRASDPTARLIDMAVPQHIMLANFFPYTLSSSVLTQTYPSLRFTTSSQSAYVVGVDGSVARVFMVPVATDTGTSCSSDGQLPAAYRFTVPADADHDELAVRVTYRTTRNVAVILRTHSTGAETAIPRKVGPVLLSPPGPDHIVFTNAYPSDTVEVSAGRLPPGTCIESVQLVELRPKVATK